MSTPNVIFFAFGNIGPTPICVVLLADGSLLQVNTSTKVATTIAPAGTVANPMVGAIGVSQWGSQYIIIVVDQTNGYFLWDGTTFYKAGGLAPPIDVTAGGSGYTSVPTVAASGGSGSGATFLAKIENGIVISIAITNAGTGYLVGETVTLAITGGGGSGATATVTLMPFGVKGTAVETYQSIVWVDDGDTGVFTGPELVNDFSTASGGGTFTSVSSYLRVKWVRFVATNGFLYLIGDSSIDYLSGVNTAGSPTPITTFTKQNADPEIGTPYPDTVSVFSRNIVLANAFGVHVSYGGAVTKVSDNLDGVYATVPNFGGFIPSAAKAIIFGKKVWILLLPVIDSYTGQHINKLFLWDGKKWFTSQQDVPLIFINFQEIDSVITAYGTNGTAVFPLFQSPTCCFRKTVQSKLWDRPGNYSLEKAASRLWGLVRYANPVCKELDITIDNETGGSAVTITPPDLPVLIVNAFGNAVVVVDSFGNVVTVVGNGTGIAVFPPTAVAQNGVVTGITLSTSAADMTIISLMIRDEIVQYRG